MACIFGATAAELRRRLLDLPPWTLVVVPTADGPLALGETEIQTGCVERCEDGLAWAEAGETVVILGG